MRARGLKCKGVVTFAVVVCGVLSWAAPALAAAQAPRIEAESVTAVGRTTASLAAVINPELQPVTACEFLLAGGIPPTACRPPAEELGEGEEGVGTGASLTGLTPNTEYRYRVRAGNKTGSSEGAEETFVTLPEPPTVATGGPSAVSAHSATVSGSVDPGSSGASSALKAQDDTIYYVEYGGTTAYGKRTPSIAVGEGDSAIAVTANLQGLEPGVIYHYRLVASNDNANPEGIEPQTADGRDVTFETTSTPPVLSGVAVSGVTQSAATITATLEAQGLPTRYELQLGPTPGVLQAQSSGNTSNTTPVAVALGSAETLSSGTVYYYTLIATNANGTVTFGGSFATAPASAGAAPGGLPAVIPFQSIAELNAKEAKEDKGIPVQKSLTYAEKLRKALKACRREKKKSARRKCEKTARKDFATKTKKKGSTQQKK